MSIQESLENLQAIYENLLEYIDENINIEENFQNLSFVLDSNKFCENLYDFKLLLHLILKLANFHYRGPNFYSKIEQILKLFSDDIKKYFTNSEIFNIFKSNKRIILFLIKEKIIVVDKYVAKRLNDPKNDYQIYFFKELEPFLSEETKLSLKTRYKTELEGNFEENRQIGENDDFLCRLIQKDLVTEFIKYVSQTNLSLKIAIKKSIFETNSTLIKNQEIKLIEYAAFYGSIQIFQYLRLNRVVLTPSLWLYAIHGQNAEMIHLLEDEEIYPIDRTYKECVLESIKCNHNDLVNYFINNLMSEEQKMDFSFISSLKHYNFPFIQVDFKESFFYLCKYDYSSFVEILLKEKEVDINKVFSQNTINNYKKITN